MRTIVLSLLLVLGAAAGSAHAGRLFLADPFSGIYAYETTDWANSKTLVHAATGIGSISAGPAASTLYFTRDVTPSEFYLESLDLGSGAVGSIAGGTNAFDYASAAALGEGRDGSLYRGTSQFSFRVDPTTGAIPEQFAHPGTFYTGDLAVDPTTGLAYGAMELASAPTPNSVRLVTLDFSGSTTIQVFGQPFTEAGVQVVGTLAERLLGLAFTLDGQLWGATTSSLGSNGLATIWSIDKTTGAMSAVHRLDHNVYDMATTPYPVAENQWPHASGTKIPEPGPLALLASAGLLAFRCRREA